MMIDEDREKIESAVIEFLDIMQDIRKSIDLIVTEIREIKEQINEVELKNMIERSKVFWK